MMRKIIRSGIAAIVAFGIAQAHAMGGSGNLSPGASPYAILEPQTLGSGAAALAPDRVAPPAPVKPRRQRR
jgi:hypothetical protein